VKSFDQMAEDFVVGQATIALPYVLTDEDRRFLRIGYMRGLSAGIEFCVDAFEPKGL